MIKKYSNFELNIYSEGDDVKINIFSWPEVDHLPKPITLPLKCKPVDWNNLATCRLQEVTSLGNS